MDVRAMVEGYRSELLDRLSALVAINSREGTPLPDAPFGEGPRKVLDTALQMMKDDGFTAEGAGAGYNLQNPADRFDLAAEPQLSEKRMPSSAF